MAARAIVQLWVEQIKAGERTLDEVPARLLLDVIEALKEK